MGHLKADLATYQPVSRPDDMDGIKDTENFEDDEARGLLKVEDNENVERAPNSPWNTLLFLRRKDRSAVVYVITGISVLLSVITILLLVAVIRGTRQPPDGLSEIPQLSPEGLPLNCGKSNQEARDRGCVFDIMAYCWMPPACFESDLLADGLSEASPLAESHKAGIFHWYGDPDGNETLPQDPDVLSERFEVWSTNNWHESHCLYFWRLLGRAVNRAFVNGFESTYILSEAIYFPHTEHCNSVLASRTTNTSGLFSVFGARRIFGECVRLDSKPTDYLEHGDTSEEV